MSEEKVNGEIRELIRSSLKINGLSMKQREEFCENAKDNFNDSYAAYLVYLMGVDKFVKRFSEKKEVEKE